MQVQYQDSSTKIGSPQDSRGPDAVPAKSAPLLLSTQIFALVMMPVLLVLALVEQVHLADVPRRLADKNCASIFHFKKINKINK